MTAYGNLLKSLIDFSDSKLSFLSEKIGYDVSYISKWCTQDKLPTAKAVPQINHGLADCFMQEIISQDHLKEFSRTFSIQVSKESLNHVIYNLLEEAYRISCQDRSEHSSIKFLSTNKELFNFFSRTFPKILESYREPLEIFCTLEICSFIRGHLDLFPDNLNSSFDIHVKMALDTEALINDKDDYLKELYYFINSHSYIHLDFYDDIPTHAMNAIIVKNHLAIMCVLNETQKILAATIINDRIKANEMLRHVLPSFKSQNPLLKSFGVNDFCRNNYHVNFYTKDSFRIFLAKGFEFFLPEACWESILQMTLRQNKGAFALINRIRVAWEEVFEKGSIEFYLLRSSLSQYIENGEIIFACIFYTLTPEERKLHIQNTLNILKKNPNIHFYVIDDEFTPTFPRNLQTSIYCNDKELFLKNTGLSHENGGPMYYTILSRPVQKRIDEFFDMIKSKPYCYAFNADDVQILYKKYQTLIERMINLN